MSFKDFLAAKKEVRAAQVKRNASLLALENTGARFKSINVENANARIFTLIDQEFDNHMQILKDDNVTFTSWILHATGNLKDDPDFKTDQKNYNKACLDVLKCKEDAYQIVDSKGLFPEVKPQVNENIDLATILDKLATDAKRDREVNALAIKNVSNIASEAAKAQSIHTMVHPIHCYNRS